jgi:proteic killer suppression protein
VLEAFEAFGAAGRSLLNPDHFFDAYRNWLLLREWFGELRVAVTHVVVSAELRELLLDYGRASPEFARLVPLAASVLRAPPNHADHFHLRIACPTDQGVSCVDGASEPKKGPVRRLSIGNAGTPCRVNLSGIYYGVIRDVRLSVPRSALAKLPKHVLVKLHLWITLVGEHGVEEVRKISGYHDEPLSGRRAGQRSIRLNKGFRAFYRIHKDAVEFIDVFEVNKHEY